LDPSLQRRVQRYGWDRAAADYEPLWQAQLANAQTKLLQCVSLGPGERVLDVACGTGLVTFCAAKTVGPAGRVVGIDLSGRMIDAAQQRAQEKTILNTSFVRMDAERLDLSDASFDVALCALGLMYMPDPEQALREIHRVLRPGGRLGLAVWGERCLCGWAALFPIVDAEVASEVCPLFFRLGQKDMLARLCADANFDAIEQHRVAATWAYADADEACCAAFVGGPVALAWSRFGADVQARVRARYMNAIDSWRHGDGYEIPGEFVIVSAIASNRTCTGREMGPRDDRLNANF
jgi:ubiquinone/menaquinone biosynthesis C-methylase UbiE